MTFTASERHMFRKYGLTPADYDALLAAQGGVCPLCNRRPTKNRRLCVDEDPDTGLIRGLLHSPCNARITDRLSRYVTSPPGAALGFYVSGERLAERKRLALEKHQATKTQPAAEPRPLTVREELQATRRRRQEFALARDTKPAN